MMRWMFIFATILHQNFYVRVLSFLLGKMWEGKDGCVYFVKKWESDISVLLQTILPTYIDPIKSSFQEIDFV